jgi:hypothetical protein
MRFANEKIILTKREKEIFDNMLEDASQPDEYLADCGCDVCPLRLACKGIDEGDCAFENIFYELRRIEKVIEVK